MNNKFGKMIHCALFLALGSLTFVAGCGPQDLNDADYLAQTKEDAVKGNLDDQDQADLSDADKDQVKAMPVAEEEEGDVKPAPLAQEPEEDKEEEGAVKPMPMPQAPGMPKRMIRPAMVAPTQVVQGPTAVVRLPSQVRSETPVVINTEEDRYFQRGIDYRRKIHVIQPTITNHLIKNNTNVHRRFFTKVIKHPTTRTVVRAVNLGTQTQEVMPTEEVIAPVQEIATPVVRYGYGLGRCAYYGCHRGFWTGIHGGFGFNRFGGFYGRRLNAFGFGL